MASSTSSLHSSPWIKGEANSALYCVSVFLCPEEVARTERVCKSWKSSMNTQDQTVWKKQFDTQGYSSFATEISSSTQFPSHIAQIVVEYSEPNYKRVFTKEIPAFDSKAWNTFHGEGAVPHVPRPIDMRKFNNEPCPYFPGKRRGESGIWTLKPGKVHGKTLSELEHGKLATTALAPGHQTDFVFFSPEAVNALDGEQTNETYWLYRTLTVIPTSISKSLDEQEMMVNSAGDRLSTGSEIIHSAFAGYVQFGTFPFGLDPMISIRTGGTNLNRSFSVGGWKKLIVDLSNHNAADASTGIVAVRKFPAATF